MTGVRLPTHQIKGLSVTIFLQKRGSLGDKSEKGGSLGVKLHIIRAILTIFKEIFAAICKILWYRWKFLIETAKIGVIGCNVVKKGGIRCTSDAKKVVYWQAHDAYRPMGVPPPPLRSCIHAVFGHCNDLLTYWSPDQLCWDHFCLEIK